MKRFIEYLSESLKDVHTFANEKDVHLDIDKNYGKNAYHLTWIDRGSSNKGSGREVMNKLHKHADEHKKEIHLVAHESHPKLISYYKSLGYKSRGKTDDGTHMIRKPKK